MYCCGMPRKYTVFAEHRDLTHGPFNTPDKVEARARLLLEQLDTADAVITKATVQYETWFLIRECRVYRFPPPYTLERLAGRLLGAETYRNAGPRDRGAWKRAIAFEAAHPPDPQGRQPSSASETAVAAHVWPGEDPDAHRELRQWRKDDIYRGRVNAKRRVANQTTTTLDPT
jgi:hypothetical protein